MAASKPSQPDAGVRVLRGPDRALRRGQISIGTHAVQYGTGAFAGIRGYLDEDGETINIFRLPDHAERLLNSAKLLRADLPFDRESLADTIVSLVEKNAPTGDVYIRPFIYKPAVQLTPRLRGIGDELAVYMLPLGDYLALDRGQKAVVSSWFRDPGQRDPEPRQAHRRLHQLRARQGRGRGEGRRRGDHARHSREGRRGQRLQPLPRAQRDADHPADHRRHPGRDHAPHDAPVRAATRASRSRSARSTGPSSTSPTRRSSAAPASRSPGSRPSTAARSARARSARSPTHLRTAFFDTVRGRSPRYADWLTRVRVGARAAEPAATRR